MAGALLERELSTAQNGRVSFDVARKSDDTEIRRVLRENPMAGRISISLEREPGYFGDTEEKQTIVARLNERVVGVGYCTKNEGFVNGKVARVGYLGGLRLDARYAGRSDILRRGYELLRDLQTDNAADFYFTTVASDNARARRFLEAGIRGMPKYEFVGQFVTVVIPTHSKFRSSSEPYSPPFRQLETSRSGQMSNPNGVPAFSPGLRRDAWRYPGTPSTKFVPTLKGLWPARSRLQRANGSGKSLSDSLLRSPQEKEDSPSTLAGDACDAGITQRLISFINNQNQSRQFAPCWSETELGALRNLGLNESDFCLVSDGGRILAVGALWDQRCFKQTVIRGYAAPLRLARPVFNILARVFKQPRLPAIGETLASAFASHIAVEGNNADALVKLVGELRLGARERGIELLTLGFAASDPGLEIIRRSFGGREYRSRVYAVHWPGIGRPAGELDGRIAGPEVALL